MAKRASTTKKSAAKTHLQPVNTASLSNHSSPTANGSDKDAELAMLRKQNAQLQADLAKKNSRKLLFSTKGISQGGKGCVGIGGLYMDRSKWVHFYPSQFMRLRRDIDLGTQLIMDNIDDMGFRDESEDKVKFIELYNKLHELELFNTDIC